MTFTPHKHNIEDETKLFVANEEIQTTLGTFAKGSLFRLIFTSLDGTFSHVEYVGTEDGAVRHQVYVESDRLSPSNGPVAAPEAIVEPIEETTEVVVPKKRSRKSGTTTVSKTS